MWMLTCTNYWQRASALDWTCCAVNLLSLWPRCPFKAYHFSLWVRLTFYFSLRLSSVQKQASHPLTQHSGTSAHTTISHTCTTAATASERGLESQSKQCNQNTTELKLFHGLLKSGLVCFCTPWLGCVVSVLWWWFCIFIIILFCDTMKCNKKIRTNSHWMNKTLTLPCSAVPKQKDWLWTGLRLCSPWPWMGLAWHCAMDNKCLGIDKEPVQV